MNNQKGNLKIFLLIFLFIVFASIFTYRKLTNLSSSLDFAPVSTEPAFLKNIYLEDNTREDASPINVYVLNVFEKEDNLPPNSLNALFLEEGGLYTRFPEVLSASPEFYLVTKNVIKPNILGTTLDAESFSIEFVSQNNALLPYLLDMRYCKIDSDCKEDFMPCQYGSFNGYVPYHEAFGCGPITNISGYTSAEVYQMCDINKESGASLSRVSVLSLAHACVNSQCTAKNLSLKCYED